MINVLRKHMHNGDTVKVTTSAILGNGTSLGITGRIIGISDDAVNPAVTIQWQSDKAHVPAFGEVTYGIRYIVSVHKWEPRERRRNRPLVESISAMPWDY